MQFLLEAIEKIGGSSSEVKVGIIGGGVTGRLVLNSLLVFTKGMLSGIVDGLDAKNIMISTRQTDNFKSYADHFGIQVMFDNEKVAEEVDFLIIATPATLDNWIIMDLKPQIQLRIDASNPAHSNPTAAQLKTNQ